MIMIAYAANQVLRRRDTLASGVAFFILLNCGCYSNDIELGSVTGVVTLDEQPIENASVSFHPTVGRGSYGTTDINGRYELQYDKARMGATLGTHKVTITTKIWSQPSRTVSPNASVQEKKAAGQQAREEMLPEKYRIRERSVLSAEVVRGKNEHNFPLESK